MTIVSTVSRKKERVAMDDWLAQLEDQTRKSPRKTLAGKLGSQAIFA
jgi:hypothetical protein